MEKNCSCGPKFIINPSENNVRDMNYTQTEHSIRKIQSQLLYYSQIKYV